MPFAGHEGEIAGVLKDLGHGDAIVAEAALRAFGLGDDHIIEEAHTGLVRVEAGEEGARAGYSGRCCRTA